MDLFIIIYIDFSNNFLNTSITIQSQFMYVVAFRLQKLMNTRYHTSHDFMRRFIFPTPSSTMERYSEVFSAQRLR